MNNAKLIVKSRSLLPDHFSAYFWDTQFTGRELLDWPEHTIERVLEYGLVEGHPVFESDRWR